MGRELISRVSDTIEEEIRIFFWVLLVGNLTECITMIMLDLR